MRRADIARGSIVSDGADYIFTLPTKGRGRRVVASINCLSRGGPPPRPLGPQSLRGHLRKLVSELRQEIWVADLNQSSRPVDRQTDPPVRLVPIERSTN